MTTNDAGEPMPVTLEELNDISKNWVLRETSTPTGYRNPGEMHLYFSNGVLLSDNEWDTGAYSQAQVTVSADGTIYLYEDGTTLGQAVNLDDEQSADNPWAGGTMFAVVLQKQDDAGTRWAPVSGDAYSGWNVGDALSIGDGVTNSVLEAAGNNQYQFLPGSAGAYEVDIDNLPGDINTYYYMLANHNGNTDDAEYTIAYYWTSADSISDADVDNTYLVQSDAIQNTYQGFDRVFSVTLNIPNIKNELTLVKTNADGTEYLSGAEYTLYSDEDGDGQYTEGTDIMVNTMTTDENGELQVTSSGELLAKGSYVLVETNAPEGVTAPMPSNVDESGQVANGADGSFSFGTITFTEAGEYTYSVSEVNNNVEGITYDGEVYTLYYRVIDEGGSLAIAESSIRNSAGEEVDAAGMNFTNIYNDGQISYQISGTKSLSTPESADTGTGSSDGEEQNAEKSFII